MVEEVESRLQEVGEELQRHPENRSYQLRELYYLKNILKRTVQFEFLDMLAYQSCTRVYLPAGLFGQLLPERKSRVNLQRF